MALAAPSQSKIPTKTNAIQSLNARVPAGHPAQRAFPNKQAALKVLTWSSEPRRNTGAP